MSIDAARKLVAGHARGRTDFRGQQYSGVTLSDVNVSGCDFSECAFDGSKVLMSDFVGCNFSGASFDGVSISSQTRFSLRDLRRVSFSRSKLIDVLFSQCELGGTSFFGSAIERSRFVNSDLASIDLSRSALRNVRFSTCYTERAYVSETIFLGCDIGPFCDAAFLYADRGCSVDWITVCQSLNAPHLERFLIRSGMPSLLITYLLDSAKALDPHAVFRLMQSTFISYGGPDVLFVRELRDALKRNGVDTFFFETDAVAGEKLHHVMRDGVNKYDRVLLVCSRVSLDRPGVTNEIEETLAREARDGGRGYLVQITLDDYIFTWKSPVAAAVRDRVVADFRQAATDRQKFEEATRRLLMALRKA